MVAHVRDFELARFLQESEIQNQSSTIGVRGTVGYTAPEYDLGSEVSTKGDVYSYGILVLEMMTGKKPVHNMFKEGLDLHTFARMALPNHVTEIADPTLLKESRNSRPNASKRIKKRHRKGVFDFHDQNRSCLLHGITT
ncbi:receptor kinase-like protein Xa21 [Cornus florida]|uniref:receptor kinase-like protein Xa21 n=1 Tax=Cornus florida TaxID=4283 RepID=UPI00289EA454|nr:receptor kinase-like protein Xa21 [Cornus florida]